MQRTHIFACIISLVVAFVCGGTALLSIQRRSWLRHCHLHRSDRAIVEASKALRKGHRRCFITSNHDSYELVHGPPSSLPPDMFAIYITDNRAAAKNATDSGWNASVVDVLPTHSRVVYDPTISNVSVHLTASQLMSTGMIGRARYQPLHFDAIRHAGCMHVYFMDANVQGFDMQAMERLWFTPCQQSSKPLCVMAGHYQGDRDDISQELVASVAQDRWAFSHETMRQATAEYQDLLQLKYGSQRARIMSAKYLGWNLLHPSAPLVGDWLTHEAVRHYQGNIALSFLAAWLPDMVQAIEIGPKEIDKLSITRISHGTR